MKKAAPRSSDAALWQAFREGSEDAYAALYQQYVGLLYSYGCRICGDEDLVKDCLQDLFLTLWRTRQQLGVTDSIKYYLFRSLRRQIARKRNRPENQLLDQNDTLPADYSAEEEFIVREESDLRHKTLEAALSHLSERQREAIFLRFYQNMEFEEIAGILEITPRAVYKLIYRAIDTLQKSYSSTGLSSPNLLITHLVHLGLLLLLRFPH